MKNDRINEAYRKGRDLAAETVFGFDPEFEKNLPENKWLLKYKFIDSELNYIDRKTGEYVDKSGKTLIQRAEEAVKELASINGDIIEEAPFIDDDTNEPILDKTSEVSTETQPEKELVIVEQPV
jgi:hypothetical protein